jgi:hypothetical protein
MPMPRPVVIYRTQPADDADSHDAIGRRAVVERLAATIGGRFEGDFDEGAHYPQPPYFVPDDALERATANRLGIASNDDLFGGVVPHAFVATKAITHELCRDEAVAPTGWSPAFARHVADAVLRGYTAFSREDALWAVRAMLDDGPVRLKRCDGIGGGGQDVVATIGEAEAVLDALAAHALATAGIVVEENLDDVTTFSVGRVSAAGLTVSYCGRQRTVVNGRGHEVYGGSTLECVRGGFDALAGLALPEDAHEAVGLARRYDAAALRDYAGMFASRRNYDVARGVDAAGRRRIGVLEQSWRVGGASGAEVRAMEAFLADPSLERVRASTVETYRDPPRVPGDAFVYFRGTDAHGNALTKYATLTTDADA